LTTVTFWYTSRCHRHIRQ